MRVGHGEGTGIQTSAWMHTFTWLPVLPVQVGTHPPGCVAGAAAGASGVAFMGEAANSSLPSGTGEGGLGGGTNTTRSLDCLQQFREQAGWGASAVARKRLHDDLAHTKPHT